MLKHLFSKHRRSDLSKTRHSSRKGSPTASGHESRQSSGESTSIGQPNSLKRTCSAVFPASFEVGMEPLVPFKDVRDAEKMNLFVGKLSLCCVTFDFSDSRKNAVEKDIKRRTLLELVDFIASGSLRFSETAILSVCKMCSANLFRALTPSYRSNSSGSQENDDDVPIFDPAWPHLQIVYDLLLKFVHSSALDAKVAKKYIDHHFISRLLDLFDSEDPRERESVKTILHRIYGKFMVHRPFIRKSINNIFYRFVFETESHNGIAELLEIFGSIISGFALPLKEEYKIFMWRVLIPLHKPRTMGTYFQQLSFCTTEFLEKEPRLVTVVIEGLLKYWPVTNSQKEVMFLCELEEILEVANMVEFQKIMVPMFLRIGCCINSLHFQVAERALLFWNNDHIFGLIAHNRRVILPIILPALERNAQNHWNEVVLNYSLNVRKMFMEMDDELFLSCYAHFKEEEPKLSLAAEKRKQIWERLENAANLQPVAERTAVLVTPLATTIAY